MFVVGKFKDREKFGYVFRDTIIDKMYCSVFANTAKFTSMLISQLFCFFFHYSDKNFKRIQRGSVLKSSLVRSSAILRRTRPNAKCIIAPRVNPVEIGVCFLKHSNFSQCFKHKPNLEKNKRRCTHTQPRRDDISVEPWFSKSAKPRTGGICIKIKIVQSLVFSMKSLLGQIHLKRFF